MALDTKMPILPIVISEYDFYDAAQKRFDSSGNITIRILEPIDVEKYDKSQLDELIGVVRDEMLSELKSMQPNKKTD